jgi:hypothetical protein
VVKTFSLLFRLAWRTTDTGEQHYRAAIAVMRPRARMAVAHAEDHAIARFAITGSRRPTMLSAAAGGTGWPW